MEVYWHLNMLVHDVKHSESEIDLTHDHETDVKDEQRKGSSPRKYYHALFVQSSKTPYMYIVWKYLHCP